LDHATERSDDGQAGHDCTTGEQALEDLTTTEGGGLPGIVEQSDDGAAVNFLGRTVVATLNRDLLGDELLDVENAGNTEGEAPQTRAHTRRRAVQAVPPQAVIALALVRPWLDDVGEQEADTPEDSESSPDAHGTGSSLFCRIIAYRQTFLAVCNGDGIQ